MGNTKRYWSGLEELKETNDYKTTLENEFPEEQTVDAFLADEKLKDVNTGRRDFLKFMGFSITAATLAACETPVVKSIPYVNKPEEITPGVANYYASTYYDGNDYANVLVKTREGRPIFIKPNRAFGASGELNPRINSSVLGLYDAARVEGPTKGGQAIDWASADDEIMKALAAAQNPVILSNTVLSPSKQRAIDRFKAKYNAGHVQYDSISYSGLREAHKAAMGKAIIPSFHFDKAKVVVSIAADFQGSWLQSNVFSADFAKTRVPEGKWMSKHFQFESNLSLSGTNADVRTMIKPSQEGKVAAALYEIITGAGAGSVEGINNNAVAAAAQMLKASRGEGIVVAGSNDPNIQMIVVEINKALGNYGATINADRPINLFQGNDANFAGFVESMNKGAVDFLLIDGVNPSYSYIDGAAFDAGLAKVKTSVATSLYADETASKATYITPDHHALESWNDLAITNDRVDLVQPTISPLFNSRAAGESILKWSGVETDYYTFMRQTYNPAYTAVDMYTDAAWNEAVQNGYKPNSASVEVDTVEQEEALPTGGMNISAALSAVKAIKGGQVELAIYQKVGMGDGSQAGNPWLHEFPDPVTKVCWDNYVTMSRVDMEAMGLEMEVSQNVHPNVVNVTVNGKTVSLPAIMQPGQTPGTIGIALGYGRGANGENIGKAAFQTAENGTHITTEDGSLVPIGANAAPLASMKNGAVVYSALDVTVEATAEHYPVAATQMHHTYMGRESVVKETTFGAFKAEAGKKKGEASWNKMPALVVHEDMNGDGEINAQDKKYTKEIDLWKEHPVEGVGHRWGMTIDLTACTGCGSCVTACHIENNVPVVGKDEVLRHRDMHWMRIDRFYSSDWSLEKGKEEGVGTIESYTRMEHPSDAPQTVHMPMMCQHCNHAPCETVCPVAATTHSNEGLNQMTYNRCIGTRYCANNCPYKVRRFNWFNYQGYKKFQNTNPSQDTLARMVLNPDVTVRSRGVMEKCSMCVQRIQGGKLEAKVAGTPVQDGAIQTACAEACANGAITFGDLNDTKSTVQSISKNNRAYHALEEIGVQPNIFYMAKVRNTEENEA